MAKSLSSSVAQAAVRLTPWISCSGSSSTVDKTSSAPLEKNDGPRQREHSSLPDKLLLSLSLSLPLPAPLSPSPSPATSVCGFFEENPKGTHLRGIRILRHTHKFPGRFSSARSWAPCHSPRVRDGPTRLSAASNILVTALATHHFVWRVLSMSQVPFFVAGPYVTSSFDRFIWFAWLVALLVLLWLACEDRLSMGCFTFLVAFFGCGRIQKSNRVAFS